MDFKLKKPCKTCICRSGNPFELILGKERIQEIVDDCIEGDHTFQCHSAPHQCVGIIHMAKGGNLAIRLAQLLGKVDINKLSGQDEVYESTEIMVSKYASY